jgi:hypothetical protein
MFVPMTWNYTKTGLWLSLSAIVMGLVVKPMAGQIVAILVVLPICIIRDVVFSIRERRRVTVLPPE